MVAEGWALASRQYSTDYVFQQAAAKTACRGVWRAGFVELPRCCRGARFGVPAPEGGGGCLIKGNITADAARIYPVPGGRS